MKIGIIGTRGIPANYGGFETFAEELACGLVQDSEFHVVVVSDIDQKTTFKDISEYKGVEIRYSKYSKPKQTIQFYYESHKLVNDCDIVYCCGVGNAFILPFFKKQTIVTNPDGIGWKRLKWSFIGKKMLKFMFSLSAKYSPYLLCDSIGVEKVFRNEFGREKNIDTIEYGAYLNKFIENSSDEVLDILDKYDLKSGMYHLIVSRLEPENNVDVIIKGYIGSKASMPLIIVGNLQNSKYVMDLTIHANSKVRFVGGIYDKKDLEVVRAHAYSYFHGHSVGGTNPSLLEAMASKNLCVCHDNDFNRGIIGEDGKYFDSVTSVSEVVEEIESGNYDSMRTNVYKKIESYYNWQNIVKLYKDYFKRIKGE